MSYCSGVCFGGFFLDLMTIVFNLFTTLTEYRDIGILFFFLKITNDRYTIFNVKIYLTHLAMERNCSDAKVPQQQCHPLSIVTCAAENNEGVSSQIVQDGHQVTVLSQNRIYSATVGCDI